MKILVINSANPTVRIFADPIKDALGNMGLEIKIVEWKNLSESDDLEEADAIIISASPRGDNANFEERVQCFQWLKTIKKPVLGICAGHQIIGAVFGGQLIKELEVEDGTLPVQRKTEDPLFKGYMHEFKVEHHHKDSVTLPDGFELLASSVQCKVQAMRHKEKPIYSVQWHAETSTQEIIRNFIAIVCNT